MKNIIETIEAKLQAQKDDIFFKEIIIKDLREKLAAAEAENAELSAKVRAVENYIEKGVAK